MTCIVGVIDKRRKRVVMGADSAGVAGLDVVHRKDVKLFKVGEFTIGCTSSFRMIQLLRFSFVPPAIKDGVDIYKYMCTEFIDAVRECFKKGGFAEKTAEAESGGIFLVGYKDRLFKIHEDYQVGESYDDFDACGCGDSYALASFMTQGPKMDPEKRVLQALQVATHFSAGVRPPFVIEKTQ